MAMVAYLQEYTSFRLKAFDVLHGKKKERDVTFLT